MRGHVIKKDGNWYVVLEMDREDGKRRQKWISVRKELNLPKAATKPQAEKLLVQKLKELHDGTYIEPSEMTVSAWLERWLEDYCKVNLRQTTYESYESFIKHHISPTLGKIELAKLRPINIQSLLSEKLKGGRADGKPGGLSPRSVNYIHTILHEALKHAVKLELINRNVAESVTPPRETKTDIQAWDTDQVNKFLEVASSHRLYPLWLLALTTGMRRGEMLGLRWKDIDWKRKTLSICQTLVVTKNGLAYQEPKTEASRRSVALSDEVIENLKFWRQKQSGEFTILGLDEEGEDLAKAQTRNERLVFTSQNGTPIHPRRLGRTLEYLTKEAELPQITLHTLRHTNATLLLRQGVHPKVVSERLGHTKTGITLDIYSHVLPDMQKEAVDKLNEIIQTKKQPG